MLPLRLVAFERHPVVWVGGCLAEFDCQKPHRDPQIKVRISTYYSPGVELPETSGLNWGFLVRDSEKGEVGQRDYMGARVS